MKKTYIIAELSANHNNNFQLALDTIKAIASTGADAVKIQTYTADSLAIDVDNEYNQPVSTGIWKGYRPYDLYKEASTPYEWHEELQAYSLSLGLDFFSSPFDFESVDLLESLNVPKYKIASLEITDIPLIKYAASKGKPMIISTGVAEIQDIELAIQTCREVGNDDITLLKCTSQYPATVEQANLRTMVDMKSRFNVKVGLSDHTMGMLVPIVATSLGADVIEKHFILDRSLGGPDSSFSMEPLEFKQMVDAVRNVEKSLGEVNYKVSDDDKLRRRSLFVTEDIKKGEVITEQNIRSVRPGFGMHPKYYNEILGKKVNCHLEKGARMDINFLSE